MRTRETLLGVLMIAVGGCSKNSTKPNSEPHAAQPSASPRASASARPSVAPLPSAPVVRQVPFDGGVALIEAGKHGVDHVRLTRPDGQMVAESWCGAPAGYDAVRAFYTEVRAAFLSRDAERISRHMAFPLRINRKSTRVIASREQFVREQQRILTPALVERVRSGDPGQVFCNAHGNMFGYGVLWAELQPNGLLGVSVVNL